MKTLLILLTTITLISCSSQTSIQKQTELQKAIFSGTQTDIELALKNGASLNEPIGCGDFQALEGAIVINDLEKFKFLLQKGAKPNKRCFEAAKKSKNKTFEALLKKNEKNRV